MSDRRDWEVRVVRPGSGVEPWGDEYWSRIPPEKRFEEAWNLSCEAWELAFGDGAAEPRLSRSVASVHRR